MKKFLSIVLSLVMVFSLSATAFASDSNSTLSIPTPEEIENYYQEIVSSQATTRTAANTEITSILSENSDIANQPLLQLGVLSSFAEENNDLTIISSAAELVYKDLIPALTAEDYLTILTNENYTNAFKFSIIDIYDYAAASSTARNTKNFSLVDKELKSFIVPNNELAIIALSSMQDKSVIDSNQLTDILAKGDLAEQKVALRTLSEEYPAVSISHIKDILSTEKEESPLYTAAINFIPRLLNNSDVLTEDEALNIIDTILANTNNYLVQITCVQALLELNSAAATKVLANHTSSVPVELVDYYNNKSEFTITNANATSITPRSTSNRLGHAIYRDGVAVIEYHAGLVAHSQGPEYDDTGDWVIHASGASGSIVEYATFDEFMKTSNNTYIGEYYMDGMSLTDHYNIFFTAVDLTNESIGYTLWSIFTTDLTSGTIEPSDINKMRCDGVVEYSYEYNNIKVLGGSTNWDVSTVSGLNAHSGTPKSQSKAFDSKYE